MWTNLADHLLLGIAPLDSMAPLFVEETVTFEKANATENWPGSRPGPTLSGYNSNLISLPTAIGETNSTFLIIPLPRLIVERWIKNEDTNKGILLGLVELYDGKGSVSVRSSEYEPADFKPLLYINAERIEDSSSGRKTRMTEEEYFETWNNKSYEEKMMPYYNRE